MMPVENERKYVLDADPVELMAELIALDGQGIEIVQGYVTDNARVRRSIPYDDAPPEYVFTFKIKVGDDLLEIETPISESDFDSLWTIADRRVHKTRIKVSSHGHVWEIDFLRDPNGDVVMIMAEVELDRGVDEPHDLPRFITASLLHRVARGDGRFQNVNLTNIEATRALIASLRRDREMILE
jgi:CYTH domain-containing protein